MQIKKDVQAVLYSFGATALVLGMGASAYYRQPPVVEIPDVIVLETPLEEVSAIAPQTETAVMVSDDVDTGDDEEADDNHGIPVTVTPQKTAPATTVTPTPVAVPKPVVTAPVAVLPTPVVTATPTPIVATQTPAVKIKKPSRQSRAS
jgi:hypothetical protein